MKGFSGGLQQMMKQANQLQAKMTKLKEELATREYQGAAGGGAVKVTMKGESKVSALTVSDDLFKGGDKEMLQDLIVIATNEALDKAKTESASEMAKLTGGANLF